MQCQNTQKLILPDKFFYNVVSPSHKHYGGTKCTAIPLAHTRSEPCGPTTHVELEVMLTVISLDVYEWRCWNFGILYLPQLFVNFHS